MDTYKQNWTRLQNRIFRFLSMNTGKSVNQRNIAKSLNVSPTAVSKALKQLSEENLVNIMKQGEMNLMLIELNRDNQKVVEYKRVENLKMIYESGLVDFLEKNFPGTTIILFGSYSTGEDALNSDIDIAIIGTKGKEINTKKFDKIFEKEIRINFYNSFGKINKNLKENIFNGIVLSGGIEL